jgi:AraC-like DNA-binding protein
MADEGGARVRDIHLISTDPGGTGQIPPGRCRAYLAAGGPLMAGRGTSSLLVPPGRLLFVPAKLPIEVRGSAGAGARGVAFPPSLIAELALEGAAGIGALAREGPAVVPLSKSEFAEAQAALDAMEREERLRRPGYRAMLRAKLVEFLLIAYRAQGTEGGRRQGRFDLEEATAYIGTHLGEDLSLAGLAARYGLAPEYFSRLFKAKAGIPLVEHINRARIGRSCVLLKRTEAEIVEIAFSVGYNNLSHFNRSFRRIVGMSPREYRKESAS